MSAQPSLFDAPPVWRRLSHAAGLRQPCARTSDPVTSHEAAIRAAPDAEPQRLLIFGYLQGRGAQEATAREIAEGTGMTMEQVCRRLPELRDAGYVASRNGKDGVGCLPLARRDGCALHFAKARAA